MTRENVLLESRIRLLKGSWETREAFLHRVLDKYEGKCGRCGDSHGDHAGCDAREDQGR